MVDSENPFRAFRVKIQGDCARGCCGEGEEMDTSPSKILSPSSSGSGKIHLGEGMAFSGLRRALSQMSMLVVKATTSGETAWREELQKYVSQSFLFLFFQRLDRAFAREIIVRLFERKEFLNSIYRFSERHLETDTIRRVQFTIVNPVHRLEIKMQDDRIKGDYQ